MISYWVFYTTHCRLFGDYESLAGGKSRDALVDMIGGVGEGVDLSQIRDDAEKKEKLFKEMEEAFENHSIMSVSIEVCT